MNLNRRQKLWQLTLTLLVIGAIVQSTLWRRHSRLLEAELGAARAEIAVLRRDIERLSARPALSQTPATHSVPSELLKLRAEVTLQHALAKDIGPQEAALKAWAAEIVALKNGLAQMPERFIPELKLASDQDWANAAWGADLATEDGIREALSKLRDRSVNRFFDEVVRPALQRYLQAHNDLLPADLAELRQYVAPGAGAFEDEAFRRYRLLQSGQLNSDPSQPILELATHVDPDYDSNHEMGINGASGGRYNHVEQQVQSAAEEFARAHQGTLPSVAADLNAYLKTPFEPRTIDRYLAKLAEERSR